MKRIVDVALGLAPGQVSPFARLAESAEPWDAPPPDSETLGIKMVAAGVGAGTGQLELVPSGERPYFFRRDFLERKGWKPTEPERFAVYKLGTDEVAWSMWPTIEPESVLLVDQDADRDHVPPRSIWIVRDGGLLAKRVTVLDGTLVLESDNREPEYAPRLLKAGPKERRHLLVGRVVWYATETA